MKPLILIIIILIISLLGFGVYIYIDSRDGETVGDKIKNLFPINDSETKNNIIPDIDVSDNDNNKETPVVTIIKRPKLFQITNIPVVGFSPLFISGDIVVRYLERGRSHIYDYSIEDGNEILVSNKTRERVQNALFNESGESFLIQYKKETENSDISSFLLSFKEDIKIERFEKLLSLGDRGGDVLLLQKFLNENMDTRVALDGIGSPGNETDYFGSLTSIALKKLQAQEAIPVTGSLDSDTIKFINTTISKEVSGGSNIKKETVFNSVELPNIIDIVLSPNKKNILYSTPSSFGVAINIADFKNESVSNIYNSQYSDWRLFWPNTKTISLITASSQDVAGYLFFINLDTRRFEKILSEIHGLTALPSPDLLKIIYSQRNEQGNGFDTFIYDTENNFSLSVSFETLAEKCVWGNDSITLYCAVPNNTPQGIYPDSWYQGKISFSDDIWSINTETNQQNLIYKPSGDFPIVSVDIISPVLSENENYLFFINKTDHTLWGLSLD